MMGTDINNSTAEVLNDERTYMVTELCPHCENEIEMRWDTDTRGFRAFCPVCGKRLMLCDECRHTNCRPCDYDGEADSCQHSTDTLEKNEIPLALRVETPMGDFLVRVPRDPEHPGVWIDLHCLDANQDLPIAVVEFCADESDLPDGGRNIITRVWGDARQEEYTDRVIHKGIEDYSHEKEAVPREGYIILCYPSQAIGMIADLGSGPTTEDGDRSSQYFAIAKGRQHMDRTVSVALIENINGLPAGKGYYTLHLIDDVNDTPCELYHTKDLSRESLVNLLKEILDGLEGETQ